MRIATWNLDSLDTLTNERRTTFQAAIAEVDADIWVLTETWTDFSPGDQFHLIAESQPAVDLEKWPKRRWAAIWARSSRYFGESIAIQKQFDRMACGAVKEAGKRDIVVIGTVLPWHFDPLWLYSDGFCAVFDLQESELSRLRKNHDECDFVFSGDFNQSLPSKQHFGSEKGAEVLMRAFEKHDLLCLTEGDDPNKREPRIDHICVSRKSLAGRSVAGTWPVPIFDGENLTDHSGVFVDVGFS